MDENQSAVPATPIATPPAHPHKQFFIIGSIFTLLMLLFVGSILYFQNFSAPTTQQIEGQVATTTQEIPVYKFYTGRLYTSDKGFSLLVPSDWNEYAVLEEPGKDNAIAEITFALRLSSSTIEGNSKAAQAAHVFEIGKLEVTSLEKFLSRDDKCREIEAAGDLCIAASEQDRNDIYVLGAYPKLHFYNYCDVASGSEPYLCSVTQNVWGMKFATTTAQTSDQIVWLRHSNISTTSNYFVNRYFIKGNSVYFHYYGDSNSDVLIEDADSKTFQIYLYIGTGGDDEYAKDAKHVWFFNERMLEADAATFTVFYSGQYCEKAAYGAADKNYTYSQSKKTVCPTPIK